MNTAQDPTAHKHTGTRLGRWSVWLVAIVTLTSMWTGTAFADYLTQGDLYTNGIDLFDLKVNKCGGSTLQTIGSVADDSYKNITLSGKENQEKIFIFFTTTIGLTPAAVAGMMGNIQQESGFNPRSQENEGAWEDMSSNDVNHGGKGGVGIVQWDGGRRPAYINYALEHKADPKDLVPQLNYIWHELNTSHNAVLVGGSWKGVEYPGISGATNPSQAAQSFHALYEKSGDSEAGIQKRMNNAVTILAKYGGSSTASGACGNSISPDCVNATGNARILCQAKQYDVVSYFEGYKGGHQGAAQWHKECPTPSPSCYLDCSGLVNIAVYDVYGVELMEDTNLQRRDSDMSKAIVYGNEVKGNGKYWRVITVDQAQPGDIIQPFDGHVEIVDHIQGSTIYTFGSHTDKLPQTEQVSPGSFEKSPSRLFMRYVGPGAPSA